MDNDANTLNGALAALQQQFGAQLAGGKDAGLGQMRQALTGQLGLDELTADRVVKKLADTGRLRFVPTGDADEPTGTTPTGPVISLPGVTTSSGSGELVVPAAQSLGTAAVLGGIPTDGGNLSGARPEAATDLSATAAGEQQDAGQVVGAGDIAWRKTENASGATMGQLADTNVEGGVPRPETVGDRQARTADSNDGYWRIG